MEKLIILICLLPMMIVLTDCSGAKKEGQVNETDVSRQDSLDIDALQRMQTSKADVYINFKGKRYHSSVVRSPDDDLPKVTNDAGNMFVDNKITLILLDGDRNVFEKTFTKRDFSVLVSEEFLSNSILEGMVYDKISPLGIVYAASISYPQTDLYIPISITVTADGKMSMKREELIEDIAVR